ncbi:MAG: M20 metallopeptidase family protein [Aureispira sp.]
MLEKKVQQAAKKNSEALIGLRRHLHQHPELSFQEHQTCQFVQQQLSRWGIPSQVMAKTGVVAFLEGQEPSSRRLALRADLDALPIQEANEVPYRSQVEGVMHACGHDVHTTCLLGAAQLLHDLRAEWRGSIQLIFQPGEEQLPGGASMLLEEGLFDTFKPTAILGQHVEPLLEVGKVGIKSGLFMASADEIYLTVKGKGGHGARPHQCVDTILMTSHLLVYLQQLVSRRADPLMPTVLSFGKIFSDGGATNIIPEKVTIWGTLRTFDEQWRAQAHTWLQETAQAFCQSMGGDCQVDIAKGYPYLKNDEALTAKVQQDMTTYLGAENVIQLPARMGGEDFAAYSQQMPACFYRLGVQNPNGTGLHTPTFDVDEDCLAVGAGLMAWLAMQEH